MSDSEDRNLPASPQRLALAREEGDIPKSGELAASLSMLGALGAAYFLFAGIGNWLTQWTTETWSQASEQTQMDPALVLAQTQTMIWSLLLVLLPFFLLIFCVAIGSHWGQTGPVWIPKLAAMDITRLGWSRWLSQLRPSCLFGATALGIPKIAIGFTVMFAGIWGHREALMALSTQSADQLVVNMFGITIRITALVVASLIILGGLDYGMAWLAHRRRYQMSQQEVRDEARQQEGDSVTRSRQRQLDRV